jgi:hypothetical protein
MNECEYAGHDNVVILLVWWDICHKKALEEQILGL